MNNSTTVFTGLKYNVGYSAFLHFKKIDKSVYLIVRIKLLLRLKSTFLGGCFRR